MPYFGEVREFATHIEPDYSKQAAPQQLGGGLVLRSGSVPTRIATQQRVWTGSEWAALGSEACNKALAAIRDDTHEATQFPIGSLRQFVWTGTEWTPVDSDAGRKTILETHDPLAQPGALR